MEKLPEIDRRRRIEAPIRVHSHHGDHRFDGKPVLPAVEAMAALAASVGKEFFQVDCRAMADARFERFLFLPPAPAVVEVFHELTVLPGGRIRAELMTRQQAGKTAITRFKVHAGISFGGAGAPTPLAMTSLVVGGYRIATERLYRDLVPFGACFHSVCSRLDMSEEGVVASIFDRGDVLPVETLGSPLVLDGALHLACAWGQRYAGIVGFPVGFARRRIFHPTTSHVTYRARVSAGRTPMSPKGSLLFDIRIYDPADRLCEMVEGLDLQDVSRGRIRPPAWVRR